MDYADSILDPAGPVDMYGHVRAKLAGEWQLARQAGGQDPENAVARELLAECGMILGAGFPDSLTGGAPKWSNAGAPVGHQLANIADSQPTRVGVESSAGAMAAGEALRGCNRATVANQTIGCEEPILERALAVRASKWRRVRDRC